MSGRATIARLSEHGKRLYHLYRNESNGAELTADEFIRNIICARQSKLTCTCLNCGEFRRLHAVAFCSICTAGAIENG